MSKILLTPSAVGIRPLQGTRSGRVAVALLLLSSLITAVGLPRTASATTSPTLLEQCISAALVRPKVMHPLHMTRAGIWPHTGFRGEQVVGGRLTYQKMPEDCAARYARVSTGRLQMVRRGRWVSICGNCVGWSDQGGGTMRLLFAPPHPDASANAPAYNSCSPHGTFHKVRIWVVNMLKRPATGTTEAVSEKWSFPVTVRGNCADAALSTKRVHALQHELYGLRSSLMSLSIQSPEL